MICKLPRWLKCTHQDLCLFKLAVRSNNIFVIFASLLPFTYIARRFTFHKTKMCIDVNLMLLRNECRACLFVCSLYILCQYLALLTALTINLWKDHSFRSIVFKNSWCYRKSSVWRDHGTWKRANSNPKKPKFR